MPGVWRRRRIQLLAERPQLFRRKDNDLFIEAARFREPARLLEGNAGRPFMLVSLVENDDYEMNSYPQIALDTLPYRWSPELKAFC